MSDSHQMSLTSNRQITEDDRNAGEVAKRLHHMVQTICISAVESAAKNRVHALMILAHAANGLVHLLARTAMSDDEENDPISSTASLFAALLAYHTAPCEVEKGSVQAEFSPLIVFDALKDAEKISGQQPDNRLNDQLCRVARECATDPAVIDKVNKVRSDLYRNNATLN